MNEATIKIVEALASEILTLAQLIMEDGSIGTNPKAGRNTLRDSVLKNGIGQEVNAENAVIQTFFNHYIDYIENTRAPKSGKMPPISTLRDWAEKNGIATDNSTLYLIARAIWRDGHEGRPILATLEQEIDSLFDKEYYDKLFEALIEDLTKYFN